MRAACLIGILTFVVACSPGLRQSSGDILIIGDSVLAWNRATGADVGSGIATELQRDVVNRAALGARITGGGFGRLSIPDQLSSGSWKWVVMNGGANDLGLSCGCTACDAEIDRLISPDAATGAIPDLIAKSRQLGARVLWVGYYKAPESRSFRGCRPALVEMERRIAEHARTREGIVFIDSEDVLDPSAPGLLAADKTHPSVRGSRIIARFIAQAIAVQPRTDATD